MDKNRCEQQQKSMLDLTFVRQANDVLNLMGRMCMCMCTKRRINILLRLNTHPKYSEAHVRLAFVHIALHWRYAWINQHENIAEHERIGNISIPLPFDIPVCVVHLIDFSRAYFNIQLTGSFPVQMRMALFYWRNSSDSLWQKKYDCHSIAFFRAGGKRLRLLSLPFP